MHSYYWLFYFYFMYLFKSDSQTITEKKTAKTAQNNSNLKIQETYFKQYCPYKINNKTNVQIRKTIIMKNNKACAYNE